MTLTPEQLAGKYARMCSELLAAQSKTPSSDAGALRIGRIERELAEIELALLTAPLIEAAVAELAAGRAV